MQKFDFDFIVIGGGGAGITAALTTQGFGKKTAIIERAKMGGECTWTGCVPSKALIRMSHIYSCAKAMSDYAAS